jgi:hypothetical protein
MSPSKKPRRRSRKLHVAERHGAALTRARRPLDPLARPHVVAIVALEAIGWHVVGLRPASTGDEPTLWRVTIERYDESTSITTIEADPDVALAELVRYVQADAA